MIRSFRKDSMFATLNFYPNRNPKLRLFALWYFCTLLIVWNIAGQTVLGFEQSNLQPVVAVLAAIAVAITLEWIDAKKTGRSPRWSGSPMAFINFLPPCIIPGLACSMLTYSNERLAPLLFAVTVSLASKYMLRTPIGNGQTQHFFNPSNIGITVTLLLMPDVGLAPPYQFTANLTGAWHWILPLVILATGAFVHAQFTGRVPLVFAWFAGFVLQGLLRTFAFGLPLAVPFVPMSSVGFTLFSLYMIPDPATTPLKPARQVLFGLAVAAIYGLLLIGHVVFGLFIALALTSAARGLGLYVAHAWTSRRQTDPSWQAVPAAGD
jgi:hypothetical protein